MRSLLDSDENIFCWSIPDLSFILGTSLSTAWLLENTMSPFLLFCLKQGKITALCTCCIKTEWKKGMGQANSTKAKLNMCLHMSVIANHMAGKWGFSETVAVTAGWINPKEIFFFPRFCRILLRLVGYSTMSSICFSGACEIEYINLGSIYVPISIHCAMRGWGLVQTRGCRSTGFSGEHHQTVKTG